MGCAVILLIFPLAIVLGLVSGIAKSAQRRTSAGSAPAAPLPAQAAAAQYYYLVDDGQSVHGPFDSLAVRTLHARSVLSAATLICQAGSETWHPLADFPVLRPPPATSVASTKSPLVDEVSPKLAWGMILGAVALIAVLWLIGGGDNRSTVPSPNQVEVASHDQQESDARSGLQEGQRVGNNRRQEGFPQPNVQYLDQILAATSADRSEAWKLGFKGGYLSAWGDHNIDQK